MIVARFPGPEELMDAVSRLRDAGVTVDTRTPVALPPDAEGETRLPLLVLAVGLLTAAGAFAMQWWAAAGSYPMIIGGRPAFFPTSYLLFALEAGFLGATLTVFVGFFAANRLPRLYEPSDESEALREASRDGWFVLTDGRDADARRVLRGLRPMLVEQVPPESEP